MEISSVDTTIVVWIYIKISNNNGICIIGYIVLNPICTIIWISSISPF